MNVRDITEAWRLILDASPVIRQTVKSAAIVRQGVVNENAGQTPWIGIYKAVIQTRPRSLGAHASSWQKTVNLKTLVQVFSASGGDAAEDELEALIEDMERLIFDNLTLSGTVDMITGVDTEYRFIESEAESIFFQMAEMTIIAEVATG